MTTFLSWLLILLAALACYGVWWVADRLLMRWQIRQEIKLMRRDATMRKIFQGKH